MTFFDNFGIVISYPPHSSLGIRLKSGQKKCNPRHSLQIKDLVFLFSAWPKNTLQNRQLALLISTFYDVFNLEHIFQNNPKPPSYIKFLVFSYCAWRKTPSWTFNSFDLIRIFTRHVTYNQQSRTHQLAFWSVCHFIHPTKIFVFFNFVLGSIWQ